MNHVLPKEDLQHILTHTETLWHELRNKRIFITGGTGFFGRWLLESFDFINQALNLNAKAVVLSRNAEAFKMKASHFSGHPDIEFHTGDVRDFEFPTGGFSHIIHAATEASAKLNQENPIAMFDTIMQGTQRVLDFAKEAKVSNFLYISSGAVYGKQPSNITHISETYPASPDIFDPLAAYANAKRGAEHLCALYARQYDISVKIARCFAFVGPYLPLDSHFAIGNFILNGLQAQDIVVEGDGSPYRSYLYASDLMIWLWTILFQGRSCRPYNVGSDQDLNIARLAEWVSAGFNSRPKVVVKQKTDLNKPVMRYVPDIKRARDELGLSVEVPLPEAIKRTIHFLERMDD